MKTEDLKLVSNLGQSLWAQPEQSAAITRETVSAVSFLDSNPERAIEKTAQALLDRANLKGMYARVPTGFNALFPEERFILLALHSGRWSYERIGRVVRESTEMVQQLAWNARVFLSTAHYPVAPTPTSPSCPEYDPQHPWTQRFLDEELKGQDKLFLQSHLKGCTSCREALVRAKDVYYRVQTQIETMETKVAQPGLTAQLHTLVEQGQKLRYPVSTDLAENLFTYLARPEVRIVAAIWAVGMIWLHFKH